ncbi:MAG TPA: F0F1 ATP synthase subunit delta [Trebonia sp.]|jgi:F-type H+-transporting ATPase subunit delta|nr:F0F1 ATP synthase subunit delta [Trebonia sp.]
MRGASRASYAGLREQLAATVPGAPIAAQVGDELFAVARLLDSEHGLRRALADGARPGEERATLVTRLLRGRIASTTSDLVAAAAAARWATPGDLADAIEQLAIEALALAAQFEGTLDDLEDDLFRFGRLVSAQPQLRSALISSADEPVRQALLQDLLATKVSPQSLSIITQVLLHPRGRGPQAALDLCASIAARRREELVAVVRVATELTPQQRQRLAAALAAAYGRGTHLNVVHDPSVIGGMSVQIGDELVDGTAASRLAEVRRRLAG